MHGTVRRQGAGTLGESALEILRTVLTEHSEAEKSQAFNFFRNSLQKSEAARREVEMYFFTNMYWCLKEKPKSPITLAEQAQQKRERIDAVKSQIALMKLMLPSGKLVEDSTFAEMKQAGSWFAKAAKLGKPNQIVGETITEGDLRKCL